MLSEGLQLGDGCRAVNVAGHQHDAFVLFGFEIVGKLGGEGGFTRTLQTGNEDDGGAAFGVDFDGLGTHQLGEFLVHNLNHQLSGLDALNHVAADCFGFDFVGEFFCYGIADIGVEQGTAHCFHRFGNVDIGNATFSSQRV